MPSWDVFLANGGMLSALVPANAADLKQPIITPVLGTADPPTFYLHTTFVGMTWLCDTSGEKVKLYGSNVEHATARDVLPLAHILLIHAADVANDFYKLEQNDRIKKIASDWKDLWDLVPSNPIEDPEPPAPPPQS